MASSSLSQQDFMARDCVITVTEDDEIFFPEQNGEETENKYINKQISHTFNASYPRGMLHRAFSVFLFNEKNELLLQQRSKDKITFPDVWTNTCCSHPLYGNTPNEVDEEEDIIEGRVDGVKNAAVRKLKHELGIESVFDNPNSNLSTDSFKYLTRLHYWASDSVTHGPDSPWGENEIDYILFAKIPNVEFVANPEEVQDAKWVSEKELNRMLQDPKLIWSPWFRIIADKFLPYWWADLDSTLNTNDFTDFKTIHRFDPSSEHMGGAGKAGPWLGSASSPFCNSENQKSEQEKLEERIGDVKSKQGAYGKVKIHKHSLISQLIRPDEIIAGAYVSSVNYLPVRAERIDESSKFCDDMLGKVSRSFAAVIRQLPEGLCTDITIFYLALRALDTIEDDMEAFKGREDEKVHHLRVFYKTGLVTENWTMSGVGEGDERTLLENYKHCVSVFSRLPASSQEVIADITARMGGGMADFVSRDLREGTTSLEDYNLYCHYVAGLVGEGLSRLFTCSGYESEHVANMSKTLANTMGLLLQKTNIIRDFLEDYVDGRAWWPQEVWREYTKREDGSAGELGDLILFENSDKALSCLNHMVTNALQCVPECLDYMDVLRTEEIFRFCAIPQVMAIATLAEVYNNHDVFTGVVKIRKGLAARMILDTDTVAGLHKWFHLMANDILRKIPASDPNAKETEAICRQIISLTAEKGTIGLTYSYVLAIALIAPIGVFYALVHMFGPQVREGRLFGIPDMKHPRVYYGAQTLLFSSFVLCASILFFIGRVKLSKADQIKPHSE